ncbi:MAG TPA: sigma 54-interacting transcriptional regulator [Polyangiaceae bacterium]|nr:sigma 54-interacting transcriptional regulator [Polyangiaceae bacterium]
MAHDDLETGRPTALPPGPGLSTVRQLSSAVAVPRLELAVERHAGQAASQSRILEGDLLRFGSHASNDVVLNDPLVSRFHCQLLRTDTGWTIADTGSLNGTFVQGVRVRDADLPANGARLSLGDSVLSLRELGPTGVTEIPTWSSFGELYGESVVMRRLFGLLNRVSQSDATVLIEGESGTGKELAATEIVRRGARADRPFLIIDCGAISPNLIESELFGHVRGAFTGADRARVGAFEGADSGTLFLDEIGEMPIDMQPKLLRALEAREIRRMGENVARRVDVRLIAATNRRLEVEVNQGRFREDLYFRLSVVTVRLPPLRKRLDDLELLIRVLLRSMNSEEREHLFTPEVLGHMAEHDWPGNVRELRNYVERSLVLEAAAPAPRNVLSSIPPHSRGSVLARGGPDLDQSFKVAKEQVIAEFEQRYLSALLQQAGGNISRAARMAKMDRMYLYRLLQRYELRSSIKD